MKKNVLLVGLILVLALVLAGGLGCGSGNGDGLSSDKLSPEDTVRKSMEACAAGDIDKCFSYFTDSEVNLADYEQSKAMWEEPEDLSVKIFNMETALVSKSADEAVVEVAYDIRVAINGDTSENSRYQTVYLTKSEDKWLIDTIDYE